MLLLLCYFAWGCCLAALAYQGFLYLIQGSWPSLTVADAAVNIMGLDLLDAIRHLSFEWAAKLAYVCMTTDLSLAFWWTGVFFCLAAAVSKLFGR
ncbi:potassium:proton antiporter [Salidesulfovibrio onnuriiensis]|uniref:potassium:proton antiporter n=1 Tax=Salidesulfovibrio onnuriiensis TaxID=2583823 RepID=UPI0011CC62D8|nr:potassium:proton antiporter [Salidesulfovibrio onnuriiensis]